MNDPKDTETSLRDWLAGLALQAILSNNHLLANDNQSADTARRSYAMADRMLVERAKEAEK